jgi:ribosomal protein S18 acetylase RimI-like enzyme
MKKLGYKIIGEKPNYYEDGTTALFMEKLFT